MQLLYVYDKKDEIKWDGIKNFLEKKSTEKVERPVGGKRSSRRKSKNSKKSKKPKKKSLKRRRRTSKK
jgi:hypothetical protein